MLVPLRRCAHLDIAWQEEARHICTEGLTAAIRQWYFRARLSIGVRLVVAAERGVRADAARKGTAVVPPPARTRAERRCRRTDPLDLDSLPLWRPAPRFRCPGLGCGLGHISGLPPEQLLPVRTSAGLWYHLVWLRPILAEKYTTHSLAVDLERTKIEA